MTRKQSHETEIQDLRLPLDQIMVEAAGFSNPRQQIDRDELNELANDIKSRGLLYPLLVWEASINGEPRNVLIGGHRRREAIKMLFEAKQDHGLAKAVPVRIVRGSLLDARVAALADNIQRKQLSSYELTQEIMALKENEGLDQSEIARRLNKHRSWVSQFVTAYSKAGDVLRAAWQRGTLPDDDVRSLAKLPTREQAKAVSSVLKMRETAKTRHDKAKAKNARQAMVGHTVRPNLKELTELHVFLDGADAPVLQGVRAGIEFAMGSYFNGTEHAWSRLPAEFQAWKKQTKTAAATRSRRAAKVARHS
jgi:ParB/RepB/Spo0J family partition protein